MISVFRKIISHITDPCAAEQNLKAPLLKKIPSQNAVDLLEAIDIGDVGRVRGLARKTTSQEVKEAYLGLKPPLLPKLLNAHNFDMFHELANNLPSGVYDDTVVIRQPVMSSAGVGFYCGESVRPSGFFSRWDSRRVPHGVGSARVSDDIPWEYASGASYRGAWDQGVPHGEGRFDLWYSFKPDQTSGETYEGDIARGKPTDPYGWAPPGYWPMPPEKLGSAAEGAMCMWLISNREWERQKNPPVTSNEPSQGTLPWD